MIDISKVFGSKSLISSNFDHCDGLDIKPDEIFDFTTSLANLNNSYHQFLLKKDGSSNQYMPIMNSSTQQTPASLEALLNGPALQPPNGVVPDFTDPRRLTQVMFAVELLFLLCTTIAVLVRLYTKLIINRKGTLEDRESLFTTLSLLFLADHLVLCTISWVCYHLCSLVAVCTNYLGLVRRSFCPHSMGWCSRCRAASMGCSTKRLEALSICTYHSNMKLC